MQNIKMIAISDIHFGAVPSVALSDPTSKQNIFEKYSLKQSSLQMLAMHNLANYILDNDVDAVLIAGDIADTDSAYFETYFSLERFLETIQKNNVMVFVVSGNHDASVIKKLSLKEDNFKLLGENGEWVHEIFDLRDGKKIFLSARSFTKKHQEESHLSSYELKSRPSTLPNDIPFVGLMHCEIGAPGSQYAPTGLDEFDKTFEDIWICGHTHIPRYYEENKKIIVPGSLQGLDPSEQGIRGGFLIECSGNYIKNVEKIPLAFVYYDNISVKIEKVSDFEEEIRKRLQEINAKYKEEVSFNYVLSLRAEINVPFRLLKEFQKRIDDMPDKNPIIFGNVIVEKISLRSDCFLDLETLSKRKDPLGILANYLTVLQTKAPKDEYDEHIQKASKTIFQNLNQSSFALLNCLSDDEEKIRESLLRSGEILLSKFIEELGLYND
ncbi:MAG: metallophosphoesterase family protein [Bdellovibrionota bacterium]